MTMNDYRTHSGLDIEADVGTPVSAFAEGTVSDIYTHPFMGHCLEVTHTGGLVSKYMNLGETLPEGVEVGAKVFGGQTIGTIGDSASLEAADAPHLHFEVFCDGSPVDPIDYLEYDTSMAYEDAAF